MLRTVSQETQHVKNPWKAGEAAYNQSRDQKLPNLRLNSTAIQ